jgi:hypothetical protein
VGWKDREREREGEAGALRTGGEKGVGVGEEHCSSGSGSGCLVAGSQTYLPYTTSLNVDIVCPSGQDATDFINKLAEELTPYTCTCRFYIELERL